MVDSQNILKFDVQAGRVVAGFEEVSGGFSKVLKMLDNQHVLAGACVDALMEGALSQVLIDKACTHLLIVQ